MAAEAFTTLLQTLILVVKFGLLNSLYRVAGNTCHLKMRLKYQEHQKICRLSFLIDLVFPVVCVLGNYIIFFQEHFLDLIGTDDSMSQEKRTSDSFGILFCV